MTAMIYKNEGDNTMGGEKRRIFNEIVAYRKKHGVGCFKAISAATGGRVAILTISHMYMGTRVQNDVWLLVGEALQELQER